MKRRDFVKLLLILIVIIDSCYSFYQFYKAPLDGDVSHIVVPCTGYDLVLESPFGLEAIVNDAKYPGPNRFFAHWFMKQYLTYSPKILQRIGVNSIDSVYCSCAAFKLFIQLLFTFLIASMVSRDKINSIPFLGCAVVVLALFQTGGFYKYMGVINVSITYTFFYAFPLLIFALYFYLFYRRLLFDKKMERFNLIESIVLFCFVILMSFNGPLATPVLVIFTVLILLIQFSVNFKNFKIYNLIKTFQRMPNLILHLSILMVCLYSIYLGGYNSENTWSELSVLQRYIRLPFGLYYIFTSKLGPPLLLCAIIFNMYILRNNKSVKKVGMFILIFCCIYILLLPLGGYRSYRPNIIRFDTFIPVTLGMIFFFTYTTYQVMILNKQVFKKYYQYGLLIILVIFFTVDLKKEDHTFEKNALIKISQSKEKVVELEKGDTVVEWWEIDNPEVTIWNAKLFCLWGITKHEVLYYQK